MFTKLDVSKVHGMTMTMTMTHNDNSFFLFSLLHNVTNSSSGNSLWCNGCNTIKYLCLVILYYIRRCVEFWPVPSNRPAGSSKDSRPPFSQGMTGPLSKLLLLPSHPFRNELVLSPYPQSPTVIKERLSWLEDTRYAPRSGPRRSHLVVCPQVFV